MKKSAKGRNANNRRIYWFRARRYAWGWDLPLTWQGWVVCIFVVGSIFSAYFVFPPDKNLPLFLFLTIGVSIILLVICWIKGEPPNRR